MSPSGRMTHSHIPLHLISLIRPSSLLHLLFIISSGINKVFLILVCNTHSHLPPFHPLLSLYSLVLNSFYTPLHHRHSFISLSVSVTFSFSFFSYSTTSSLFLPLDPLPSACQPVHRSCTQLALLTLQN